MKHMIWNWRIDNGIKKSDTETERFNGKNYMNLLRLSHTELILPTRNTILDMRSFISVTQKQNGYTIY